MQPSRILPLLAAANVAAASAGMVVAGILQLIATDLHWSPAEAGRLITYYALGFAIGAPLLGAVFGTWCRKKTVMLGLTLVSLGSLASALAPAAGWLEAARVVVAAGCALAIPSVSALAAFLFPDNRARALAVVLMGMTVAMVLGVPAGTFLASVSGWRATFVGAAGLAAFAAGMIKILLPGGIVVPPVPLSAWGELMRTPRIYVMLALPVTEVAATFSVYGYIAPFVRSMVGVSAQGLSWLLLWFGIASLGANALLGGLGRRVGLDRLLTVSMIGLVFSLGLSRLTEGRLWLMVGLFGAWALCNSWFGTLQQSRIIDAAPSAGPALLALNTSATFIGQAIGTTIGGVAIANVGIRALPLAGATLALIAVALFGADHGKRLR